MFGLPKDVADGVGEVVGTAAGIAIAPIAVALGVSERAVKAAVRAGCKTEREVRNWIEREWDE